MSVPRAGTQTEIPPAWHRFDAMSAEVHEILLGAAQCRNHLAAALECWEECDDSERREMVTDALERLTRVAI